MQQSSLSDHHVSVNKDRCKVLLLRKSETDEVSRKVIGYHRMASTCGVMPWLRQRSVISRDAYEEKHPEHRR